MSTANKMQWGTISLYKPGWYKPEPSETYRVSAGHALRMAAQDVEALGVGAYAWVDTPERSQRIECNHEGRAVIMYQGGPEDAA